MGLLSFIYSVLGYNLCATLFIAYLMFDYVLGALATLGARYVIGVETGRRVRLLHPLDPRRLRLDGAHADHRPDHVQKPQEV